MNNSQQPKTATGKGDGATGDIEKLSLDEVYKKQDTMPQGLGAVEAEARLPRYGRNELQDKQTSNLQRFLRYFRGPIPFMIEAAAALSSMIGHWSGFSIIMVLLIYNAVSGFWQERKGADALAALKAGMAPKARVLRDGQFSPIDAAGVVPGDKVRSCRRRRPLSPGWRPSAVRSRVSWAWVAIFWRLRTC